MLWQLFFRAWTRCKSIDLMNPIDCGNCVNTGSYTGVIIKAG